MNDIGIIREIEMMKAENKKDSELVERNKKEFAKELMGYERSEIIKSLRTPTRKYKKKHRMVLKERWAHFINKLKATFGNDNTERYI